MEAKIATKLGSALVDAAYRQHTRRGIRLDCYCEWCYRKRQANAEFYVDYMRRRGLVQYEFPVPHNYRTWDNFDEVRERAIVAARQHVRTEIRRDLYKIYPRPDYDPAF